MPFPNPRRLPDPQKLLSDPMSLSFKPLNRTLKMLRKTIIRVAKKVCIFFQFPVLFAHSAELVLRMLNSSTLLARPTAPSLFSMLSLHILKTIRCSQNVSTIPSTLVISEMKPRARECWAIAEYEAQVVRRVTWWVNIFRSRTDFGYFDTLD